MIEKPRYDVKYSQETNTYVPRSLKCMKTHDNARIERSPENAGYDLWCPEGDLLLLPYLTYKIDTGLRFEIPQDWLLIVKERSSIGSKGIAIRAGVVDWSYRGNLHVCLQNCSDARVMIPREKAFAQVVMIYAPYIPIESVDEISENTDRGAKGFGSTDND